MWNWNLDIFRACAVDEVPGLALFVRGLVVEGPGGLDIRRSVLCRYDMQALPLIEWDLTSDIFVLFAMLRASGSSRGYFIDYPERGNVIRYCRECALSVETATTVAEEGLMRDAIIFVDGKFLSMVASWYTDFAYLCMKPELFGRFLRAAPMSLDLYGEPEAPALDYASALSGARRRLDQWSPGLSATYDLSGRSGSG